MSRPDTVYGRHPVMELLRSRPDEIRRLHVMEGKTRGPLSEIVDAAQDARIKIVWTKNAILTLWLEGVHQGVVAFVNPFQYSEVEDILERGRSHDRHPLIWPWTQFKIPIISAPLFDLHWHWELMA